MLKFLMVTLVPVSGCVTGYTRDTDRVWPATYDNSEYYVVGWKEKFYVKPGRMVWPKEGEAK